MQNDPPRDNAQLARLFAYDAAVFTGCGTALFVKKRHFYGRALGFELIGEIVTIFAGINFIGTMFHVHHHLRPKN